MKRYQVGFFTVKDPKIDSMKDLSNFVVLWKTRLLAADDAQARIKVMQRIPLNKLRAEVARRHPRTEYVGYTYERLKQTAVRSWGRIQFSFKFSDIERIQRGELTRTEEIILARI